MTSTNTKKWAMAAARMAAVTAGLIGALVAAGIWAPPTYAQSFNSGSDGSDGELNLGVNLGVIVFDPNDTARWGGVLDADGDGVYNFTTITIAAGTTLKVTADKVVRPVYWLASGNVSIAGSIDLSGAAGPSGPGTRRTLAVPGAGGFSGGAGGNPLNGPGTKGDGPGGGHAPIPCGNSAGLLCGGGGMFTSNRYLIPLLGGSGGGGTWYPDNSFNPNGGAGGGAILLASSTSIAITGAILANGGNGGVAGGGSGGAIRLAAPNMSGAGTLDVRGGTSGGTVPGLGSAGMVRLERFTQTGTFSTPAGGVFLTVGSPVDFASLRPAGLVRVTAVAGVPVSPNAAGSFVIPDVTISGGGAVPVEIEALGVPPGTVVTLQVYPQSPDDPSTINLPAVEGTLSGTVERSTATINFVFPYGFSRGTLRATW